MNVCGLDRDEDVFRRPRISELFSEAPDTEQVRALLVG
jgi:hypothetical protein